VQEEYWRRMAKPSKANAAAFYVEYGDNVEGTGFVDDESDLLGSSPWNLSKFPGADDGSPLKLLQTPVPGVTTPYLYHGALFSTFCWHIEDLYLLSVNYLHIGAPKTWYGVPAKYADQFEKVVADKVRPSACCEAAYRPCGPPSTPRDRSVSAGVQQNVCQDARCGR
jgi:JmjC domain, hydroxylase